MKQRPPESPATSHGKHFSIKAAYCEPGPDPRPPSTVGGGEEKITLRLVGEHADGMNLRFTDPSTCLEKDRALIDHCENAGRKPDTVTLSLYAYIFITPDGQKPAPRSGKKTIIYGTSDRVVCQSAGFMRAGVQHSMIRFLGFPITEGLELFQNEVIPKSPLTE